MNPAWIEFLASRGAVVADAAGEAAVRSFGNPSRELTAARDGSVVAPLSQHGVLRITGKDASEFLHGQLSSDVNALAPMQLQASTYCSPKGRVLANFLLWRDAEGFDALLSRDLLVAIKKRLAMFVLRSKVAIEDVSEHYVVLGAAGPAAATALQHACGAEPAVANSIAIVGAGTLVNLGGKRYLALLRPEAAHAAWLTLATELKPVGEDAWRWLDIGAGAPWITAPTQDQFVPQMANFELIGAVNFQKGCYTGQEIVARTQYLGKLKRRMFLCHVGVAEIPAAGSSIYSAAMGEQACGMVVNAAPAPEGGCDLLAVLQLEAADTAATAPIHLSQPNGPELQLLELPYAIPQAA
jgi:folate-binding protein YgfZ